MDLEIYRLQLSMMNESLSDDPTNPELILEKLRILRELSKFTRIDLNEFKNLNFDLPEFRGNPDYFYHAWGVLDRLCEQNKKYNNFHVSVIGNQTVEIHNISTKYTEMNPNLFYYIGVVFGKQKSIRVPHWISEEQKITFIQDVQTKYGNLFNFPEAVDPFIPKSLVGIEEACPICMSDKDLETCVAVRNGRCDHAFHRDCIKCWFAQCGRRICPTCRVNHDKTG